MVDREKKNRNTNKLKKERSLNKSVFGLLLRLALGLRNSIRGRGVRWVDQRSRRLTVVDDASDDDADENGTTDTADDAADDLLVVITEAAAGAGRGWRADDGRDGDGDLWCRRGGLRGRRGDSDERVLRRGDGRHARARGRLASGAGRERVGAVLHIAVWPLVPAVAVTAVRSTAY